MRTQKDHLADDRQLCQDIGWAHIVGTMTCEIFNVIIILNVLQSGFQIMYALDIARASGFVSDILSVYGSFVLHV